MKIMILKSYFVDEDHRIVELTDDEYNILIPFGSELSMGNIDESIWDLIDTLSNNSKAIRECDIPKYCDIELAIC